MMNHPDQLRPRFSHDPAKCGAYRVSTGVVRCPCCLRMIDTATNREVIIDEPYDREGGTTEFHRASVSQ